MRMKQKKSHKKLEKKRNDQPHMIPKGLIWVPYGTLWAPYEVSVTPLVLYGPPTVHKWCPLAPYGTF